MQSDQKLKQLLAKMLPEKVHYEDNSGTSDTLEEALSTPFEAKLLWKDRTVLIRDWPEVLDTELLHLCWLVEETLNGFEQCQNYCTRLGSVILESRVDKNLSVDYISDWTFHATWQQRTIAISQTLGIEIV